MSALYPINPANPLTALSQDFQAAPGVPVSIVGSGSGALPAVANFSTINMPLRFQGGILSMGNLSTIDNGQIYFGGNQFQFITDNFMTISADNGLTLETTNGLIDILASNAINLRTSSINMTASTIGITGLSSINGSAYRGANPLFSTIGVSANNDSITEGITFGGADGCFQGYNTVPSTFEIKTNTNLDLVATQLMQIVAGTVTMSNVSSINNVNFTALVSTVNGLAA